jgi:hypothetical protein
MARFTDVKCSGCPTEAGSQQVYSLYIKTKEPKPCYLLALFCKGWKALGPRVLSNVLSFTVSGLVQHPYLTLT